LDRQLAVVPNPGETTKHRGRTSRVVLSVLAVVFLLTTLGGGFFALKQRDSSLQWRHRDEEALALSASLVTRNGELSRTLAQVNGSIASLNSQTSRLNNQVKSLQTQLVAAKQAKVTALGRSVLGQLTKQAASVSSGLAMCVTDMNSLRSEINHDMANLRTPDPHLQPNTQNTDAWCATARQDNQQLQSTLSKAR
jgi:chromosome segregation ATPase